MSSGKGGGPLTEAFNKLRVESECIDYAIIDAFSDKPFGGNPAAVIILPEWKDDKWLQSVASEFNLSETAYMVKKETREVQVDESKNEDEEKQEVEVQVDESTNEDKEKQEVEVQVDESTNEDEEKQEVEEVDKLEKESEEGKGEELDANTQKESKEESAAKPESKLVIHEYHLRWFTPKREVDLCGHATLASAHLLFHVGIAGKMDTIFFHTRSGILSVRSVGPHEIAAKTDSDAGRKNTPTEEMVEMNFPWITTTPCPVSVLDALPGTLKNVIVMAVGKASGYLIVELPSVDQLEKLKPDVQELLNCDSDGLLATAPGDEASGFDFVSRCFFPNFGVNEDPVTGSAHSILGPYWSTNLGKNDLLAFQASERGGALALQMDKKIGRVRIRGQATIVMVGVLLKQ